MALEQNIHVPLVDTTDQKAVASQAVEHHHLLLWHLSNSLRPGASRLPAFGSIIGDFFFEMLLQMLHDAEIVLWRPDLRQHAEAQAEEFMSTLVEEDLLQLNSPQLWLNYPLLIATPYAVGLGLARLGQLLLPISTETMTPVAPKSGRCNDALLRVEFFFPLVADKVDLSAPPSLHFRIPLTRGQSPRHIDDAAILSCVTFLRSSFIEEGQIHLDRAAQRRLKRQPTSLSSIRVVQLRKKVRPPSDEPHLSDREYQCQFMVRAHVRKPNPRMRVQRPVWVSAYIKGPEDKPLKASVPTVNIAKR